MSSYQKVLLLLVWSVSGLLTSLPVYSMSPVVVSASVADELHYKVVQTLIGTPDEDEIAFLKKAAVIIHKESFKTGFEFCGNIARQVSTDFYGKEETIYALNITTNEAHVACVSKDIYPAGFNLIGKSIHSHGKPGAFRVNLMDTKLSTVFKERGEVVGRDLDRFSDVDLQHPGYLVTSSRLIYQNGTGKEVVTDYGKF